MSSEPLSSLADHAPGLDAAFATAPEERCCPVLSIEGVLPAFLRGTYYLNGPARFERGGFRYRHWLDGDGMVCAVRFGDEGVRFTGRYVRGAKWLAEEEAGEALFRAFGTAFPGDRLLRGVALASPVNVSIYPYLGRLLAFGEQGLPWELDPETLETRGEHTFGGRLNALAPFAAHPKIDPETGELFNFGISYAAGAPQLNLYRFGGEGELVYRRRLPLPYPCSVHDFALSRRYVVFYLSPYLMDVEGMMRGGRCVLDSLLWEPERGSSLLIADRETGEAVASVPVGEGYSLHAINAFEQGDRLVFDVLELDRPVYDQYKVPDLFPDVSEGRPVRFAVDPKSGGLLERREIPYSLAPDFPSLDPSRLGREYDELWMLGISATGRPGRKIFDQLVHARWSGEPLDVWQAPPGVYLAGEPAFAPEPGNPEGGAVLCPLFDSAKRESAFAVFDARHVARGPVAVLRLGFPIHLAFHAMFEPEL